MTLAYPSLATIVKRAFPLLDRTGLYVHRSPCEPTYNCIAFAVGDSEHWWWPGSSAPDWWPPDLRRDGSIAAFEEMFAFLGYAPCSDENYENGFEKVALFADGNKPTHAARQEIGSGHWLSKLGKAYDISHHNLRDLECRDYGRVVRAFRRDTSQLRSTSVQLLYAYQDRMELALVSTPHQGSA